jgi:predicted outer membrane repeat protein
MYNSGNPTLTNVTFNGNEASYGGGMNSLDNPKLTNVTFNGNSAYGDGGGMYIGDYSSPVLTNVTFSNNSATSKGGGIYNTRTPILQNIILWGNSATNGAQIYNNAGSVPVVNNSIIQGGYAGGTNIITTDPMLGTLGNYGGFTQTIPLLAGSSAIDTGNDANCPATDQRGVTRPQGSHCDIGAYEFNPKTIYVKWDATGLNNGTSWANAYINLQSALSAASNGDDIWVAAGTYKPTTTTDRTISFNLKNGVAIYGGFVGTETLRSQRNVQTNVTILSGDIGVAGNNSDNSYHVVVGSNTDNTALLDGFTVRDGNASSDDYSSDISKGGGIYNNLGSPSIKNVIIDGNHATFGGGMYNYGDPFFNQGKYYIPIVTNVVFSNNSANEGGGMRNDNYSSPILTDVNFENNVAGRGGGGMENFNYCNPTLTNVTFKNNTASGGGGMMNWTGNNPVLKNVTFSGNLAYYAVDGIPARGEGGGIYNYTSNPTMTNVTFSANVALSLGGGIYSKGNSTSVIHNTILWGNTAPDGAQIYNISSTPVISNSVIQGGYAGGTNIITTEPMLGTLGNYGGFTQTIPLLSGSSAIDAGNDANCPATDQRGVTRPQGSHCDIGAYEVNTFTPLSPIGLNITWNNTFSWIGTAGATNYQLEVYDTNSNALLFRKWLTATETSCSGDSSCVYSPLALTTLGNGNYRWRVQDYTSTYGTWTPYLNFNVSTACYSLSTSTNPSGTGTFTTTSPNCAGGKYTAGTIVQITAIPNTGFVFLNWSGDGTGTSGTASVTMNSDKTLTANLRGATLSAPSGELTSWNNTFSWAGASGATSYQLEVYDTNSNTLLFRKWLTATATSCDSDLSCTYSPASLANLSNGNYRWRIQYYASGYGLWTPYTTFTLNQP